MSDPHEQNGEKLPQPANAQSVQLIETTTEFSGPLPPPALLAAYDRVVPGAAERIIIMAEAQSKHRRDMESQVVASDIRNARRGLLFGFMLGLVAIGGGIFIVFRGQAVAGTIFSGLYLVGIVGVFVYGSQQRRRERQERQMK